MKNVSEETGLIQDRPLPSRKEFHQRKAKRVNTTQAGKKTSPSSPPEKKKRLPLTRSLLLAFMLLVVFILTYNLWFPKVMNPINGKDDVQKVQIESHN
ncbi:hypothetical protein SAMN04488137_1903 [Fictibacillus solisalsi]|uniref:Uncharacterized protein n=1 Tax=Fictibacillus solisalsi TaxID=459525 RepID=A0A1G9W100_9BACL|nr:hypothetical protein [Fictibacillus solisalsi]SDM78170.1 hypothetical protein SAMN04488137_1903 [Fictibacillus solisalsi]